VDGKGMHMLSHFYVCMPVCMYVFMYVCTSNSTCRDHICTSTRGRSVVDGKDQHFCVNGANGVHLCVNDANGVHLCVNDANGVHLCVNDANGAHLCAYRREYTYTYIHIHT
jgi:hypothetical protein